jgi:hypothetical protein
LLIKTLGFSYPSEIDSNETIAFFLAHATAFFNVHTSLYNYPNKTAPKALNSRTINANIQHLVRVETI